MNSIGKIALNFRGDNEAFFRALYGSWDVFYEKNIENATDEVVMDFDDDSQDIEIGTIELDLGYISEENFIEQFKVLYREKLIESLQAYIYDPSAISIKRISKGKKLSDILCYFLLHGSLPWNVEDKYKDINLLFLEVAKSEAAVLKKFLLTYGHYTSLQQRLVFQLNDRSLEEGVRLIAPGESSFIISYVHFLHEKYKKIERPVIKESAHREVVWQVVYAYLLTNRTSFFNKKAFIKHTVQSLSARHNLSYRQLLKIITAEMKSRYDNVKIASELFMLLGQLEKEIPKETLEGSVSDIARLYKVIATGTHTALQTKKENTRVLHEILRKEDSCRRFLQYLDEAQIIILVKIVVPNDHTFVVSYAKSLDRQKEQGVLQGKAGGEFRLLKWQIIFPILLENNGTGFNRKYFVLRTLKRVAAHYNLDVKEILIYFLSNGNEKLIQDEGLRVIFEELFFTVTQKPFENKGVLFSTDLRTIILYIRNKTELSEDEVIQWKLLLTSVELREKVLSELKNETEHISFITALFPQHSSIIIAYAKSLDVYKKRKALEGKTAGKFMQLKWKFIHAVLFEPQQQVFNKKYFVSRVLFRIAAHYNLKVEELIVFFYREIIKPGNAFPFELVKVLKELYEEQLKIAEKKSTKELIDKIVPLPEEKAKKRLEYYFGTDAVFAFVIESLAKEHEFVAFIEEVLKAEMMLRRYVIVDLGLTPDVKALLSLLMRFSKEYQSLSRTFIMTRVLLFWMDIINTQGKRMHFENKVIELAKSNKLLKEALVSAAESSDLFEETVKAINNADMDDIKNKEEQMRNEHPKEEKLSTFVSNAGLVLLWPYLARLFEMLLLTEENKFISDETRIKAMFVMQYAVFGMTEFAEHELELNKLFTGLKADVPIPSSVELAENEKDIVKSLLQAVINNWSKLKDSSIDALRGNFLVRNGKLEEYEDFYQLTVEERAYDILLGSLPWSISTIKLSWMEKGINVKWR